MFKLVSIALLAVLLSACSDINGTIRATYERDSVQDFARSQILIGSPAAADGSSEILIVIQLTNSDGTPVKFYQPTFEVVTGGGVTSSGCTTSDANGVSTCIVKSLVAGVRRISVNNIKIVLEGSLEFRHPTAKPLMELVADGGNRTQSGYKMSATVGGGPKVVNKTSSGWKLYGGLEGLKAAP